ncbi:hypothetical protein CEUSTIGMA_g12521.t1 [Chlamydomonas eustigma]|uniref:Uncharacterized protein n=1 Tax=Chlamydomonas eustigma TaxID=1157962 RepID=A0A250XPU5_9CHLO|nr:hypothetical protein CEUSTIGMA_g12521.t1 [Chlamydomonas eustigma]|eukprot:GAX85101.1 hypothetical protein CEUSTIGMA_g12521.t1 [Chlamydomonas eustigma]
MSLFNIRLTSDDLLSQPAYGEQDEFSQYSRDAPPGTETQQDEFENGIIMPDHYTQCIQGILLPTQATAHAIAADEQQQEEVEVEEDEQLSEQEDVEEEEQEEEEETVSEPPPLVIEEEKQKKRRRKSTTAGGSSTEQPLSAEFIALAAQLHNLGSPLTLSDVRHFPIDTLRNLVAHTERQMLTQPPVRLIRTVKEAAKPKPPKQKVVTTITLPSTLPAEEAATSKQPLKKRVAPALAASTAAVESLQKKHKTAAAVVGTSKEPATNSPATLPALEGTAKFLERWESSAQKNDILAFMESQQLGESLTWLMTTANKYFTRQPLSFKKETISHPMRFLIFSCFHNVNAPDDRPAAKEGRFSNSEVLSLFSTEEVAKSNLKNKPFFTLLMLWHVAPPLQPNLLKALVSPKATALYMEYFVFHFAIEMDIGEELTKNPEPELFHLLKPFMEGDLKKFNSVRKKLGLKELDSFGQKATISIGSSSREESSSSDDSSDSDSDKEEANKKGRNAAKANKISSRPEVTVPSVAAKSSKEKEKAAKASAEKAVSSRPEATVLAAKSSKAKAAKAAKAAEKGVSSR